MSIEGWTRQGEWRWAGRARRFRPPRNIHCVVEAGIRAREGELQSPWRAAFPWGCPTVALLARPLSPTVAGAAQELKPKLRFRTCFPFNRRRINRRQHLNGQKYSAPVRERASRCRFHGHVSCRGVPPARIPCDRSPRVAAAQDDVVDVVPISEKTCNDCRYRLTLLNLCHYSSTMDTQLSAFEKKLQQLLEVCHRLRSDNARLRRELDESRSEVRQFQERIEGARARLEKLVEQMPDQTS